MSGNGKPRGRGTRGRGTQQPPPPSMAQQRPPGFGPSTSAPPPARLPPADPRPRPVSHAVGAGDMSKLQISGPNDQSRGGKRGRRPVLTDDAPIRTKPVAVLSKQGTLGVPVELQGNYFAVVSKKDFELFQYRVDFSDPEERVAVRSAWLGQHSKTIGSKWQFDGTMLFSTVAFAFPDKPITLTSFKNDNKSPVEITIKYANRFDKSNHQIVQLFNLILRRCMGKLQLKLVRRNLFDDQAAVDIPAHKISIWPGYETSIRQHEDQFLLNCEFINKVMRMETAHDILKREGVQGFERSIIGSTVMTKYNTETYRVDDIAKDKTPLSTFEKGSETYTFVRYYKERYNVVIEDVNQPLLISRPKGKDIRGGRTGDILLVPELCKLTGLNDAMRNNFNLMKAMSDVVHISPSARIDRLKTFNNRLLGTTAVQEELKAWGLQISTNLVELKGRQLPPETLLFGRNIQVPATPMADWTRTSVDKPMLINATLPKWFVIVPGNLERDTMNFVQTMRQLAGKMEFIMPEPDVYRTQGDSGPHLVRAIEDIVKRNDPSLLFIAVSNVNADRYSAIKKKCYIDRGISCQVVTGRVLKSRNMMTIASKVAIQINTKLGGSPWTVNMPKMGAMIVGFDVCHDPLSRSKSCGALVATSNPGMTSYYSCTTFHTEGEELSDTLGNEMVKAVHHWQRLQKALPARIIVYRDGVGDGQIKHVYEHEVKTVKRALEHIFGSNAPVITYILVTKRINTRVFLKKNRGNPGPGLVVDSVITLPEKYDFFLVSQTCKQGTVMPTCYNIIEDNCGWTPDKYQRLTFILSHLYYNFSATVRVPAMVQYAHRLAFIVSQSLHGQPNPALCDRLFFI